MLLGNKVLGTYWLLNIVKVSLLIYIFPGTESKNGVYIGKCRSFKDNKIEADQKVQYEYVRRGIYKRHCKCTVR